MAFKNIMFICTGNICRSPMAEYLMKQDVRLKDMDITIISAGLGALVGHSANEHVRVLLENQNIHCKGHIAQQVNEQLVQKMDLILVMEQHHRQEMLVRFPEARSKLFLCRHQDQFDIPDPYKKDMAAFEQVEKDIKIGIDQWVNVLTSF